MALKELPSAFTRLALRDAKRLTTTSCGRGVRWASAQAAAIKEEEPFEDDLESQSSLQTEDISDAVLKSFDPIKRARSRTRQLPSSR